MAYPLFMFGMVGLGGAKSDLNATGSFFLGQAQVSPATMRYWLWRVRGRPTLNSGQPEGRQLTGAYS